MLVARSSRWYGSLGLYDPAPSYSPYGRLLLDEGQQHFSTEPEALRWLHGRTREAGDGKGRLIFTNDGLVLRYVTSPEEGNASVTLWQIYVGGHHPRGLPGADDGALHVDGGVVAEYSKPH